MVVKSLSLDGSVYEVSAQDLTWRPAVYGIVLHEDRLLVTKQVGTYHLPGGGVELGEDPAIAIVREIKEETGLDVDSPELITVQNGYFSYMSDTEHKLKHVQALKLFYCCQFVGGQMTTEFLDDWEQKNAELAEWVQTADLDSIKSGSTFDWKSIVRMVLS